MIVVSDTSPIRTLTHLSLMDLLRELFGEILIPPAVQAELSTPPGGLVTVEVSQWDFIRVESPTDQEQVDDFAARLDPGESEALALALERRADAVLIDERIGRAEAQRVGLAVIGTLGILVRAKERDLVDCVKPFVDQLQNELGFFISDSLRTEILRLAGESPT